MAPGDEVDGQFEFLVESEGAPQIQLLGYKRIHRQVDAPAETNLHHHRPRPKDIEGWCQRLLAAGRLEHDIECAFVGSIGCQGVGLVRNVDRAIGANGCRRRQWLARDIGRHDFSCSGTAGGDNAQGSDRPGTSHENTLSE